MSKEPKVLVSSLKRDPGQPRKLPESDDDLEPEVREVLIRLGESMRDKQLQPILYLPGFIILAGERRWRAARLVGLKEVWAVAVEEPLTPVQNRSFQIIENAHRAPLKAWEEYLALKELRELTQKPWKDLAALLHLAPASITQLKSVEQCIPSVQEALKAGTVGKTDVYEISQLAAESQQEALDLKLKGASRDELRRHGRKKRAEGEQSGQRASRIKVPLVGGATVTVASGEEMSLEEAVEAMSEAMKLAKAALAKGIHAKTAQSVWKDLAAAG